MHGDAMRTGIQAGLGGAHHVRFGAAARVAQDGDLVDVDAELGHGTELLGKRGRVVVVVVVIAAGLGLFAQAAQLLGIDQRGRVALQVAEAATRPRTQASRKARAASRHRVINPALGVFSAKAKQPSASSRYNQYIVGSRMIAAV
jgi:hypothetical protein